MRVIGKRHRMSHSQTESNNGKKLPFLDDSKAVRMAAWSPMEASSYLFKLMRILTRYAVNSGSMSMPLNSKISTIARLSSLRREGGDEVMRETLLQ